MPLTLTIRPNDRTPAAPPPLRLEGRGAIIGRGLGCDWTLPDERATVSSRHCAITFEGGGYIVTDTSTNGTAVNGRRIDMPQPLNDGDMIGIGPYDIAVAVSADVPVTTPKAPTAIATGGSGLDVLLAAAGVRRADVAGNDAAILQTAGRLLRELTAGTTMLIDHRNRAREQIGVADRSGSGGLALPALLADGESSRRIASAFDDLDAHQLAALKAMQAAMQEALDRFSPAAIRKDAGGKADDAALWQSYQRAFGAAETGFGEVFAARFRTAFEGLAKRPPPR
jgi:predicted component of type VI protein secretion system